ncbi:TNF receptor-associated factor 5-like [Oopsacas minuta]|uniref:TNF receptor-associated factor 5-like n=1 Tax=Oopsacas minuta TaxID=111878 RepID=A0AAV7K9T3_9METZ|nr:TNF receptor-associated factor 5-like [Oopsacas minuta]
MASKLISYNDLLYCKVDKYGYQWLGGYNCEYFTEQLVDTEQICPVCNGVSREPVQTPCGHLFCSLCLDKSVESQNAKCPIDKESLTGSNFRDKREEKRILSKRVKCPRGCDWESMLSGLESHLVGGCEREELCTCGASLGKEDLVLHKLTECPKRIIKCEYCREDIEAQNQSSHLSKCQIYPRLCSLGCGEKLTIPQEKKHQDTCPNMVIPCSFSKIGCVVELMRSQHDEHLDTYMKQHLVQACDTIMDLRIEVSELTSLASNKPYIWKVTNIEESIQNNIKLTSVPFYREGYKFCARLSMGGIRQGEGTHISAHLAVMKGANDSNLEWPIKAGSKFSFTVLNQQTDRLHVVMSKTIHPDDFLQPTVSAGKFWGFNKLISHKQLFEKTIESEYCVKDTMFLSVQLSILSDFPKWLKP